MIPKVIVIGLPLGLAAWVGLGWLAYELVRLVVAALVSLHIA